jgi:DNA-binding response OmpR family regulator
MKEKILIVEDDPSILTGLEDLLSGEGYDVLTARDGRTAVRAWQTEKPRLILLDVMIPEKSGLDVCREIRLKDVLTPIVMLTAKGRETDKVVGLELGADDYIVKPFGIGELLARVRAALRRASAREAGKKDTSPIEFRRVRIDPKTLTGTKNGESFSVTAREIELLRYFAAHPGEVVERFTLLDEIWGVRYEGTTRTLDQHIAKLRQKIEDDPGAPRFIQTVYGVGYRFNPSGE